MSWSQSSCNDLVCLDYSSFRFLRFSIVARLHLFFLVPVLSARARPLESASLGRDALEGKAFLVVLGCYGHRKSPLAISLRCAF